MTQVENLLRTALQNVPTFPGCSPAFGAQLQYRAALSHPVLNNQIRKDEESEGRTIRPVEHVERRERGGRVPGYIITVKP